MSHAATLIEKSPRLPFENLVKLINGKRLTSGTIIEFYIKSPFSNRKCRIKRAAMTSSEGQTRIEVQIRTFDKLSWVVLEKGRILEGKIK